jgi:hypothetical protein
MGRNRVVRVRPISAFSVRHAASAFSRNAQSRFRFFYLITRNSHAKKKKASQVLSTGPGIRYLSIAKYPVSVSQTQHANAHEVQGPESRFGNSCTSRRAAAAYGRHRSVEVTSITPTFSRSASRVKRKLGAALRKPSREYPHPAAAARMAAWTPFPTWPSIVYAYLR